MFVTTKPVVSKFNYPAESITGRHAWMWVNQDRNALDLARALLNELEAAAVAYRAARADRSKDRGAWVGGKFVSVESATATYNAVFASVCGYYSMCFSQGSDKTTHWTPEDVHSLFASLGEAAAITVLRQAASMIERYILDAESRGGRVS